jgi:hypothetical protein
MWRAIIFNQSHLPRKITTTTEIDLTLTWSSKKSYIIKLLSVKSIHFMTLIIGWLTFCWVKPPTRIIIKFTSFVSTDYRINVVFVYTILFFGADCISLKFIYKFYLFKKMLVGNKKIQILIEQETTLFFCCFRLYSVFQTRMGRNSSCSVLKSLISI